ncbi:MAG: hypothetical protein GYA46_05480 [candidate division Zixibacteria bacterium]|nr:hypothetical protein [candidate division Zixibacteria bacterium]
MDLKYSKATDSAHTVKLTSSLIYAAWKSGAAPIGQAAPLEVVTAFVGQGASIKITGKSDAGKSLGSASGKIFNNVYVGELTIPDSVKIGDTVYFEVDLSANGVKGESNHIPAVPPVEVTNMKWSASEARRGDILTLSATVKGVPDKTEVTVRILEYDADGGHDITAELPAIVDKNKLEVKWEYTYFEDVDDIATQEEMQKYGKAYNPPEYFFVVEVYGQKHGLKQESKLLLFKDYVDIVLTNQRNQPIPDQDYVLYLPDGSQRKGKLDKEGRAVEKNVPPGDYRVEFPNL